MWYLEDGLVGGWSRQWWLGVKSPPQIYRGPGGDAGCRTYLVSSGMASRVLPYTLQELCRWRSAAFPPLWSLQTGRSVPLNVSLPYPPMWSRAGGCLSWDTLHGSH